MLLLVCHKPDLKTFFFNVCVVGVCVYGLYEAQILQARDCVLSNFPCMTSLMGKNTLLKEFQYLACLFEITPFSASGHLSIKKTANIMPESSNVKRFLVVP